MNQGNPAYFGRGTKLTVLGKYQIIFLLFEWFNIPIDFKYKLKCSVTFSKSNSCREKSFMLSISTL